MIPHETPQGIWQRYITGPRLVIHSARSTSEKFDYAVIKQEQKDTPLILIVPGMLAAAGDTLDWAKWIATIALQARSATIPSAYPTLNCLTLNKKAGTRSASLPPAHPMLNVERLSKKAPGWTRCPQCGVAFALPGWSTAQLPRQFDEVLERQAFKEDIRVCCFDCLRSLVRQEHDYIIECEWTCEGPTVVPSGRWRIVMPGVPFRCCLCYTCLLYTSDAADE